MTTRGAGFGVPAFLLFVIVGAAVLDHPWIAGLAGVVLLTVAAVVVARKGIR